MHCQTTFGTARNTGNHILIQLKANQSKLFDAVCTVADTTNPADTAVSHDRGRSRAEDRSRGIMARARSFARNIMRKNGVTNGAEALWNGAPSLAHILAYSSI